MAEYVYPLDQTIASGNNVLLQDSIPCNKGYVIHRNGSGILTLRGIVNNPCAKFARYFVEFNGNIALPEGWLLRLTGKHFRPLWPGLLPR